MAKAQSCRDCKFLEVAPGEKRMSHRMYPCTAPMPDKPVLPESVSHFDRAVIDRLWRGSASERMSCPNYGQNCPTFQRREKAKA